MSSNLQHGEENQRGQGHVSIRAMDIKPPRWDSCDEEIEQASRQAFTAYELAMRRGHHPRLWQAIKGSPFQTNYEIKFRLQAQVAKILVADDDPLVHRLYGYHVSRAGWQMIRATNGREAVELAARDKPQVVVMDIMMPEMDGLTAIRELKRAEATRGIPVLLVTANPGHHQLDRQPETIGAAGLLIKPLDSTQLVAAIRRLLPA